MKVIVKLNALLVSAIHVHTLETVPSPSSLFFTSFSPVILFFPCLLCMVPLSFLLSKTYT